MNPWLLLAFTIVIEVVGSSCIKASDGFSKPLPTVVAIGSFIIALYLLSIITKILPLGIVYAVWSGVGIILTSLVAYFAFGQKLDLPGGIGITLILLGVLVINLFSQHSNH
ncbi:DMT family transporter [[Haemophilus] ducreyi]|uniref:DMT family transporter n=1 Tax=Haemophilus ducreyi TaxID=730 RepID=UPI00065565B7|nr:SMR family transporter [[Haemophilus] ducreyi]AKO45940.1 multidrug transporter [[Haemophilus] ducreyi]AKO47299.1 multidrug transporter [[Haemophilus] ducreyi]AKO48665.1 multidrug transporter [[Haemophilus] ducreyi]AKO50036.1 multidrug transporter [[Haemophilus] ducreyi]ANF61948.1 multidrug transporter [[Haemophilus] ducreyi]